MGSNTAAPSRRPGPDNTGQDSQGAGAEPGGALQGGGSTLAVYQDLHLTPVSALRQRLACRVDEAPDRDRPAPGGPQGNDRSRPAGMGAVGELRLG